MSRIRPARTWRDYIRHPSRSAKAIVAFLAPVLSQLIADLPRGVTGRELATNMIVSFLTAALVWAVPNAEPL